MELLFKEMKAIRDIDIAFIPIGGTLTMDMKEPIDSAQCSYSINYYC